MPVSARHFVLVMRMLVEYMFGGLYGFALWAATRDPEMLRILTWQDGRFAVDRAASRLLTSVC
jgi:hypothetical protein